MKRGMLRVGLVASAIVLLSGAAFGQTIEEVEEKLIAASAKVKSFTADMNMVVDMTTPDMTMKTKTSGTMEFLRDGDKVYTRSEMKSSTTMVMSGQETKTDSTMLSIMDGEYVYTLTGQMGRKTAMKMKIDPKQAGVAYKGMFKDFGAGGSVKVAPSESVSGEDCYVIEVTPAQAGPQSGPSKFYFSKDRGMMVKMVTMDGKGKPFSTMTMSNWKLNPKLDASRFKFTPPAGVQVMDMTNL